MNSTIQHILIPTDFSQNALNATDYALRFFKSQKITFHFLHIDISLPIGKDKEGYNSILQNKNKNSEAIKIEMAAWMQKVYTYHSNVNHHLKDTIVIAPFIEGVRNYIKNNKIEFLVMGTKGTYGIKEMTIGSRTSAVITRVKCSILVIPEKANFSSPIHIGFPTDFNMLYKDRAIKTLLEIANMYKSSIKVLRIAQTQKQLDDYQNTNRELLKQLFSGIPHSFHVIEDPNLENALQSFVNTMNIDMVAMIAKNLNFFQRILFKPQVEQISYHMQIPFLVLHD